MCEIDRFEAMAELFYRRFGVMAPGKSEPMEWRGEMSTAQKLDLMVWWMRTGQLELDFIDEVVRLKANNEALTEMAADSGVEIERLKDLICEAAPLAWVHNQDMDGAQEWERRASEALGAK